MAANGNGTITGRGACPCIVGVSHEGNGSGFWRLYAKHALVVLIYVSCFSYPSAGLGLTGLNAYHDTVFRKGIGDCFFFGQFIGPDIINCPGVPEEKGRENDINPGCVIVTGFSQSIAAGNDIVNLPLPGNIWVLLGIVLYRVIKAGCRSFACRPDISLVAFSDLGIFCRSFERLALPGAFHSVCKVVNDNFTLGH